jgi:hypothetical protein
MTPDNPANLEQFLEAYGKSGEFLLLPAVITDRGPEVMYDLAFSKRHLSVKDAVDIGENDIEATALREFN